jgi:hypothetical protein
MAPRPLRLTLRGALLRPISQTSPNVTLWVNAPQSLSNAMRVRATGKMYSISLAFKRWMQDRFSARF